jgi:YVTN family beta-propeller protein
MKNLFSAKLIVAIAITAIGLSSCEDDNTTKVTLDKNVKNIFITNEGAFGNSNGSISIYQPDSGKIINYIFESANEGKTAGDVIMSFGFTKTKGYIISNGNNLLKVVDLSTFQQTAELTIDYPRFFLLIDTTKAYVSAGKFAGSLKIINLTNNTSTDSILVGNGPEHIIKSGNYVYVCNSGGWIKDSTVSVVDIYQNKEIKKIKVGQNPNSIVIDANGDLWVMCMGYYNKDYTRNESRLVKINHNTLEVDKYFIVGTNGDAIESKLLEISSDKKTLYYQEDGGIYAFSITGSSLSSTPFIATPSLNGIAVDPSNGDIYGLKGNVSGAGEMLIFDRNGNSKGSKIVGIGPNGAVFNY